MADPIAGLRKKAFVVFGRAGIDLYADPVGTRSSEAKTFRADLGGSAANTAVGLAKLGAKADLLTSVSDDAVGWFCLRELEEYGVGTKFVGKVAGEARTSLAFYESVVEDFQNVIYRNGAADFQVTEEDALRPDYESYGAFVTSGTALAAEPSRSSLFSAVDAAKSGGLTVIFDIDYRPYSWSSAKEASEVLTRFAEESDVIVGNDEEFDFMAGGTGLGYAKAKSLAGPSRIIVYKMGAEGAVTFADGSTLKTGIFPVTAVKPNGAGDSFMAGFLASLGDGHDLETSLLRGSAAAAIVVSQPGCAPPLPTPAQLDAFIADHHGPTEPA